MAEILLGLFVSAAIGALIGAYRGYPGFAAFLGFFLGPLGWLLVALIDLRLRCPQCQMPVRDEARLCPHCGEKFPATILADHRARKAAAQREQEAAARARAHDRARIRVAMSAAAGAGASIAGVFSHGLATFDRLLRRIAGPENQIVYGFLAILSYVALPLTLVLAAFRWIR